MAYQPPTAEDAAKWPGLIVSPSASSDGAPGAPPPAPPPVPAGGSSFVEPHPAPDGSGAMTNLSDADYWRFSGGQPAGAPPPAPEDWPGLIPPGGSAPPSHSLLDNLRQGTSDVVHGLAGLPGLAYDVAAIPQNLLAAATGWDWLRTVPAQKRVSQLLDAAGLPPDVGPGWSDKAIEFMAGVPTGAGIGAKVASVVEKPIAKAVVESLADRPVPVERPIIKAVAQSFADRPGLQTVAAAGAGTGAKIAQTSFPNSPTAEALGALAGGFTAGGAAGLTGFVKSVLSGETSLLDDPAELAARLYLGQAAAPEAAAGKIIQHTREPDVPTPTGIREPLPNLRTTAETAGDPGLSAVEQMMRGGDTTGAKQFGMQNQQRQAERRNLLDEIVPPDSGSAFDVALQLRQNAELAHAAGLSADHAAAAGLTDARTAIGPELLPEQAGAQMQPGLAAARAESSADVGAAKLAVDPDGVTAIPTRGIKRAINAAADERFGLNPERRPGEITAALEDLATPTVSFKDLQRLREEALSNAQDAFNNNNSRAGFAYSATAEAIRQGIEDAAANGQGFDADALARFNLFRAKATEHGARFNSDPIEDAINTQRGRFKQGETTVPSNYFQPGEIGGDTMKNYMDAITNPATGVPDPALLESMMGYIAGRMGAFFPPGGAPDPAALAKFLSNHAAAIRRLPPELREQLGTLDSATQMMRQTSAATADSVAAANSGAAKLFLGGADPDRVMAQALNSKNAAAVVADLKSRVAASPQASEALRRSYINVLASKLPSGSASDANLVSQQAAAQDFIERTQGVRRLLFPPEQQRGFDLLAKDLSSVQDVATQGAPTAEDLSKLTNAQVLKAFVDGLPIPQALKNFYNAAGQPTLGQMRGLQWLLNGTTERVQQEIFNMARDPDALAMLLRRASPEGLAKLMGRADDLRNYGFVRGSLALGGRGLAGLGRAAAPSALRIGAQATGTDEIPTITVRPER